MRVLESLQNALHAAQTAREGGDYEMALIEAHNVIDCANEFAVLVSREFLQDKGTFPSENCPKTV